MFYVYIFSFPLNVFEIRHEMLTCLSTTHIIIIVLKVLIYEYTISRDKKIRPSNQPYHKCIKRNLMIVSNIFRIIHLLLIQAIDVAPSFKFLINYIILCYGEDFQFVIMLHLNWGYTYFLSFFLIMVIYWIVDLYLDYFFFIKSGFDKLILAI